MAENARDPRKYFKFHSCDRCFHKPCDRLRFGGVYPGKFIFVHNSHLGTGFFDCLFVAKSFDEIERLVEGLSLSELVFIINDILAMLTTSECLQYQQHCYVSEFSDAGGRMQFLKALWDDQIISVIRVPDFFSRDKKMRQWLYANEGLS